VRRAALITLLVLSMTAPAFAAWAAEEITPADIDAALDERRQIALSLADITAQYEASVVEATQIETNLSQLAVELGVRERELVVLRVDAENVARELYMNGGMSALAGWFNVNTYTDIEIRQGYLELVAETDQALLTRLEALEQSYLDQQVLLEDAIARQAVVTTELDALASEILDELEAADQTYRSIVSAYEAQEEENRRKAAEEAARRAAEEAARRAAASTTTTTAAPPSGGGGDGSTTTTTTTTPPADDDPPPPPAGRVCPIDGPTSFTDSWGAPRSGGRTHQGVDMISPRGTPLVAIESGTISRLGNGGLGGITIWMRGSGGDEFYYAHLDGWASGLSAGQSVSAGQLIGYVGNTGNAIYTVPHLHFEYHPGGGSAVNPYPLVAELCN